MIARYLYSKTARRLATAAALIAPRCNVLFHGTRYTLEILADDKIDLPKSGDIAVSLTRSSRVAAYWAVLGRDNQTRELPGIFILDRTQLRTRYRLEPFHFCDRIEPRSHLSDEMEERVVGRPIENLERYATGLVVMGATADDMALMTGLFPYLQIQNIALRSKFTSSKTASIDQRKEVARFT